MAPKSYKSVREECRLSEPTSSEVLCPAALDVRTEERSSIEMSWGQTYLQTFRIPAVSCF